VVDYHVLRRTLSGGNYAVFKIEHTAKAVADFWASFPADMAKSEYKMDFSRPIMERYSIVMVKHGYCEMCVPIL
jgi:DNA gyrase inhibitor GyrI